MDGVSVRPMRAADLDAAKLIVTDTYGVLTTREEHTDPVWLTRWQARAAHLLATDPGGCWVAQDEGRVIGFALSFRREDTWVLSGYAVRRDVQGRGVGRLLLRAAETHGAGCPRALLSSSSDPRALARYRAAGFTLLPQHRFTGVAGPRATAGTTPVGVRRGTPADLPFLDDLDRRIRGAPHGPDHVLLLDQFPDLRLLTDDHRSGYAYLDPSGAPVLLCGSDVAAAGVLLDLGLRSASPGTELAVGHVTDANPWAIERLRAAGLTPQPAGFLAVRGMEPPAPYLHHGALL